MLIVSKICVYIYIYMQTCEIAKIICIVSFVLFNLDIFVNIFFYF